MYSTAPCKDALTILGLTILCMQLIFVYRDWLGIAHLFSTYDVVLAESLCQQSEWWCRFFVTPLFYGISVTMRLILA